MFVRIRCPVAVVAGAIRRRFQPGHAFRLVKVLVLLRRVRGGTRREALMLGGD
jgi:hypothetical protein